MRLALCSASLLSVLLLAEGGQGIAHAVEAAEDVDRLPQGSFQPAVFCGKGDRPDTLVCFTDPTRAAGPPPSEEQQRELRELLQRRADELRRRLPNAR